MHHNDANATQGSVWGSGLAGIICAGVALARGDAAHLWQVLLSLHSAMRCQLASTQGQARR